MGDVDLEMTRLGSDKSTRIRVNTERQYIIGLRVYRVSATCLQYSGNRTSMIFSRLSVCRPMCFCMKKFILQEVFKIKQLNSELMFQLVIPTLQAKQNQNYITTNFKNHYLKTIDTYQIYKK